MKVRVEINRRNVVTNIENNEECDGFRKAKIEVGDKLKNEFSERYTAIKEHFKNEKNIVELMRTNEWSCYLYDNFNVSASDSTEQFWYNEMGRRAAQGWCKIKRKRRTKIIERTTDKWEKMEIRDNAELFEAGWGK